MVTWFGVDQVTSSAHIAVSSATQRYHSYSGGSDADHGQGC